MTNYSKHTDLIDAYLSGSLSSAEESSFMELMETDPVLKDEFMFQQSIVGGLREYRKDELKQRLNSITVGAGLLGFLMNFASYKLVAAVLTIGILGYGAYFTFDQLEIEQNKDALSDQDLGFVATEISFPRPLASAVVENYDWLSELEVSVNDLEKVSSEKADQDKIADVFTNKIEEKSNNSKIDDVKTSSKSIVLDEVDDRSTRKKLLPSFSLPDFSEEDLVEETQGGVDISEQDLAGIDFGTGSPKEEITVKKVHRNNRNLQYKFQQGKLYLYGDFRGRTYELLEINSSGRRDLYFFFDSQFFKLNQYQKSVSELKLVENKRLIKELEIIRSNK